MPSKLSRYLDGIMEAAWLAAVILVPTFFNQYSNRIFEPDKIAILRSLALLILAAWSAQLIIERSPRQQAPARPLGQLSLRVHPLALPVAGLALVYLISTALSIHPIASLWGSYQRLQGTYTFFSYLVIGLAIAARVRSRAQAERLLDAMVLASLPVSLYGVLQRFGLDPVPWGGDVTTRIAANLGNSIFVAAYLIMAFPATAVRAVTAVDDLQARRGPVWQNAARGMACVFAGGLQVAALVFSGSRGPLLGWLAGVFFLFVMLTLIWRRRALTLGVIGAALAVTAFLVIFNLPETPLQGLRAVPGIGRLGALLDAESKTGRVRTLIWQGAARLVAPHAPLEYPDGRQDVFNTLRLFAGYGPESMLIAFNRFYPPELTQVEKRDATPDRAHNETWDALITTGLLGLVASMSLFGGIFYYGLKWLGLVPGNRERNLFFGLFLGLGALSATGFVLWQGPAYFGVGLPFGMVAGLLVYLMLVALWRVPIRFDPGAGRWRALILTGALAAILGHFVEINFGIAIAATRLYFWSFAGLLAAVGWQLAGVASSEPATNLQSADLLGVKALPIQTREANGALAQEQFTKQDRRQARRARPAGGKTQPAEIFPAHLSPSGWLQAFVVAASGALSTALVLFALSYDFLANAGGEQSILRIVSQSLFQAGPGGSAGAWVFFIFLATWLFGGFLFAAGLTLPHWARSLAAVLVFSAVPSLAYLLWHAGVLAAFVQTGLQGGEAALGPGYDRLFTGFCLALLGLLAIFANSLPGPAAYQKTGLTRSWSGPVLAAAFVLAALSLAAATDIRPIQADMLFKQAEPYVQAGAGGQELETALAFYRRAHLLAPGVDFYLLQLGSTNLTLAEQERDPARREGQLAAARAYLETAQSLNPLNPDHSANLARLYAAWVRLEGDRETGQTYAEAASEYFSQAVSLSPNNARLWDEWAALSLGQSEAGAAVLERLTRALELDPFYDWTHALLGEYWARLAGELSDPQAERQALEQAAGHYQEALRLVNPQDLQTYYTYLVAQAAIYVRQERQRDALANYQQAAALLPESTGRWQLEEIIAQLYLEIGDHQQALEHAAVALALAPEDQQARLAAWVEELK